MATALAHLGALVDEALGAMRSEGSMRASEFDAPDLSLTSWAMSKLGFLHLHLLDSIASEAIPKITHAD